MTRGPKSGRSPATRRAQDAPPTQSNDKIKVVVRVRPKNRVENAGNYRNVVRVMGEHMLVFDPKEEETPDFYHGKARGGRDILKRANRDIRFAFDNVFAPEVTTHDVYTKTTKSILDGLLEGFNCSVFAYGATGAGKTFTMLGAPHCPGVIFLTMMDLYSRIDQIKETKTCDVAVSYLEVYNEQIRDLLMPGQFLPVREDPQKGVVVHGLSLHKPHSAEELMHMLEIGNQNRSQHPTDANAESSRSHAVFQVFVRQRDRTANLSTDMRIAKMSLIDLAGSERATVTKNQGARFREGANINRSLLALGNCINALADGKSKGYVPYRNSKLTRLLKDSLGGNCRTVMIAAVSPSSMSFEDTYNTLKYADRAKNIQVGLKRNVVSVDFHISRYVQIVEELRIEVRELKEKLHLYEDGATVVPGKDNQLVCQEKANIDRLLLSLHNVFHTRIEIRKEIMELEASERDLTYRVFRKQVLLARIALISSSEEETTKRLSRAIEVAKRRQQNVEKRKRALQSRMNDNVIAEQNVEAEMRMAGSDGNIPEVLQQTLRSRHLEIELRDTRRHAKYLKKLCRVQEREAQNSERLISVLLQTVKRQFYLLKGHKVTSYVEESDFEAVQRLACQEKDREVSWADQSYSEGTTDHTPETPVKQNGVFNIQPILEFPILSCVPITPKIPGKNCGTPGRTPMRGSGTPRNRRRSGNKSPFKKLSDIGNGVDSVQTTPRQVAPSIGASRAGEQGGVSMVTAEESVASAGPEKEHQCPPNHQSQEERVPSGIQTSDSPAKDMSVCPAKKLFPGQNHDRPDSCARSFNDTFTLKVAPMDGVFPLEKSPPTSTNPPTPLVLTGCGTAPIGKQLQHQHSPSAVVSTNETVVLGKPIPCPVFHEPEQQPEESVNGATIVIHVPTTETLFTPQHPYVQAVAAGSTGSVNSTTVTKNKPGQNGNIHSGTITKVQPAVASNSTITKSKPVVNRATVTKHPVGSSTKEDSVCLAGNRASAVRMMDFGGVFCGSNMTFAEAVKSPAVSVSRDLQKGAHLRATVRSPLAACDNLPPHNLSRPASRRMTVAPGDMVKFEPKQKLFGRGGFTRTGSAAKKAVSQPLQETGLPRRHTVQQRRPAAAGSESVCRLQLMNKPSYMQMTKAASRRTKNHRRSITVEEHDRTKGIIGTAQRVSRDENRPMPQRRGLAQSRSKSVSAFGNHKSTFF